MGLLMKLLPLVLFLALAGFLAKGLTLNPTELPSPLIDKQAPAFTAESLLPGEAPFDSRSLQDRVWVLNVWASWCAPCVQEHPLLIELASNRQVPIVGLNYKDRPQDALPWLQRLGNPFTHVLDDRNGDVGLDFGVYGVPETFVIDGNGLVRHKHVGPLDVRSMQDFFLPALDAVLAGERT